MTTSSPGPAAGLGLATFAADDRVLDTWYPFVTRDEDAAAHLRQAAGASGTHDIPGSVGDVGELATIARRLRKAEHAESPPTGTRRRAVVTIVDDLGADPSDAHDIYLRLHLLSNRLTRPHEASVEGAFSLLNNVVWSDLGPCDPDSFEDLRLTLRATGVAIRVRSVDKFPRMTDYVIPSGVRIGDADRVRLGAHLASGTVVMHEGFVNFNAGTLGRAMVEGRISAGVIVGDRSDVGGSASVMGTLSGGGSETIRIGEGCLIGANAGVGISLGDGCVVEAGLYVTSGARVTMPDGTVTKAAALSGRSGLLYRRNSQSGAIEVLERAGDWGGLNEALHAND